MRLVSRFITAASDGDLEAIKTYLADGLDVNSQDWDKLTALVAAASQGHLDVVKHLLDKVGATLEILSRRNTKTLTLNEHSPHREVQSLPQPRYLNSSVVCRDHEALRIDERIDFQRLM